MNRSVKAFAPASVANAICGFDVLGFAMEQPGDVVTATHSDQPGIRIAPLMGAYRGLPTNPQKNTAGVAVQALLNHSGSKAGLDLVIEKGVPMVGGMGSSASSAVAAVLAVNELLDLNYSTMDLLPFILASEKAATGVPHADNAAPSLLGGFSLIRSVDPLDVVQIPTPDNFSCALVHPHMQIKTMDARKILPEIVPLRTATKQMGHVAGFVLGMFTHDLDLISRSLVDELAEPHRGKLIPGYDAVRTTALDQGALGCGISGSGPSMFALCADPAVSEKVARSMQLTLKEYGLDSDIFLSAISKRGAHVLD